MLYDIPYGIWDDGNACHRGNLTKCGSLNNKVGAKLILMVDWSTIELRCSTLSRGRGQGCTDWDRLYMALCSDFHPKGGEGAFNYVVTALSKVLAVL